MDQRRQTALSRRDFLRVGGAGLAGAALLGSGTLSGCGGSEESGGATEIYYSAAPDESGTTEKLIKRFNQDNEGKHRVIFRQGNSDTGQRFDKLRTEMQAGGENIDVILGDVIWTAQLAESGWISDLSERFTDGQRKEFLPGSVEAITYQGKAFGMPWYTDTGLLYYRNDLLQESGFDGPPKTWDELKQVSGEVRGASGTKFGFAFQGARYEGGVCNGMEFIWTHGGEVLDPQDPTKVLVDSPEAIAGLAAARAMITDGTSPQAVTVYKEDESAGAFLNGDAVFLRNWPYVYALVGTADYPKLDLDQVGVSELPSADGEPGNGTVGDQPLYISSSATDPEAAWKFIQFLTAPEQQKMRAVEGSYLPTRSALYDDAEIQEKVPVVPLARDALQHTRPRPVSPYYSDMSLEMAEQFNASLAGDISPEEAARTLKEQLESFIQQGQEV
ncbi:MAG: ABC transporter substrate-binding protein [Rubrobacter sp.]